MSYIRVMFIVLPAVSSQMLLKYCGVIHRMNKALWGKLGQFKWALVAAIVVLLITIFCYMASREVSRHPGVCGRQRQKNNN